MIIREEEIEELPLDKIVIGDGYKILKHFPDESVDCVITSPPYWSLRDNKVYTVWGNDSCKHEWDEITRKRRSVDNSNIDSCNEETFQGQRRDKPSSYAICFKCGAEYFQLGLEPSLFIFVEHLIAIFKEIKRVLKSSGTVFVVLDDTYSGSGNWEGKGGLVHKDGGWERRWVKDITLSKSPSQSSKDVPRKSLCLVPEFFALRMVHELGFLLRNKLVWYKRNSIPESVKDRFSNKWEYIYFFTKSPKYFFDLDAVRESYSIPTVKRITQPTVFEQKGGEKQDILRGNPSSGNASRCNKMVQSIAKQYTKYEQAIGRIGNFSYSDPIHTKKYHSKGKNPGDVLTINTQPFKDLHFSVFPEELVEFLIKAGCPERGIVLDPFLGSGTTALIASKKCRSFIGIELNEEYVNLAYKRIKPFATQKRLDENEYKDYN